MEYMGYGRVYGRGSGLTVELLGLIAEVRPSLAELHQLQGGMLCSESSVPWEVLHSEGIGDNHRGITAARLSDRGHGATSTIEGIVQVLDSRMLRFRV